MKSLSRCHTSAVQNVRLAADIVWKRIKVSKLLNEPLCVKTIGLHPLKTQRQMALVHNASFCKILIIYNPTEKQQAIIQTICNWWMSNNLIILYPMILFNVSYCDEYNNEQKTRNLNKYQSTPMK